MSKTNSIHSLEQLTTPMHSAETSASPILDAAGHALFEHLGVGGMGEVDRRSDDALHRDLVIKVLKPEPRGDAAEERFPREARLIGSSEHPGIVPGTVAACRQPCQPRAGIGGRR
jgi:hypothetical protein